ncbi:MAG: DUF5615 family PIN-like protein [Thermoleophilaceae bacterium]
MKLLLDEQISGKVAERLGDRGHDVGAVTSDPNLAGSSDPDVFAAAQVQERAVVTYNRDDFLALAQHYGQVGREHHGLVIVNPKRHPNDQFSRLVNALDKLLTSFSPYPSFVTWLKD